MTARADPFASHRRSLLDALRGAVEAVEGSHASVLRAQLASEGGASEPDDDYLPALLCLLTADALGGRTRTAQPAALALALLELMARVFVAIDAGAGKAGSEPRMAGAWGLPRALNGGDAFYTLAQSALLALELDEERRLQALEIVDSAARRLAEELCEALRSQEEGGARTRRALLPAAAALGGLCAGAGPEVVRALSEFGESIQAPAAGENFLEPASIASEGRSRLVEAARYIAEVG